MPRVRVRKTGRGQMCMRGAFLDISVRHISLRAAAKSHGICHVTLLRYCRRRAENSREKTRPPGYRSHTKVFSVDQERKLEAYIKRAADYILACLLRRSTAILTDSPVRAALEEEQQKRIQKKKPQKKPPAPKKRFLTVKNTAPTVSSDKDEECLVCDETSAHPCLGKCGFTVSFASSGHMRHALRVQNIISVTTVTMSRLMPF
ncbi:uncharacterized protein LOC114550403 [Perca flavescens]|uniref:uncharacterized protein LOC114550403 n=1 Tax=Perca flavescens TaxID=8167 RepID=UPI00106E42ED|nr:uncharacterized protein LOC114550403 [Perca flavescens]